MTVEAPTPCRNRATRNHGYEALNANSTEARTNKAEPAMSVRPPHLAAANPMGMAPTAKATMKMEVRRPICELENENRSSRPLLTMGMNDIAMLFAAMKSIKESASESAPRLVVMSAPYTVL